MTMDPEVELESLSTNSDTSCDQEQTVDSQPLSRKKVIRFSKTQVSILNAYYQLGMTGVGKNHASLIAQAVRETKLTDQQVKVRKVLS